jgi:nicotinamide mononucleotide transporter
MYMKNKIYIILIIIFSIICGILSKDYFLWTLILMSGLLNAYYASIGKIYNYIFGAIYCVFSGYVCYLNWLYWIAVLSLLVFFPSQIHGYLMWNKNKKENKKKVKIRWFTLKNSIIITTICIVGSFLLWYLLSKIPWQNLAFLDASSNIIQLCGIVLMNMRFKECWVVWLFNNTIDLIIRIINFVFWTPNATMMLIVSIWYLLINVYWLIKWIKLEKDK